jgi:hypothetical protein
MAYQNFHILGPDGLRKHNVTLPEPGHLSRRETMYEFRTVPLSIHSEGPNQEKKEGKGYGEQLQVCRFGDRVQLYTQVLILCYSLRF